MVIKAAAMGEGAVRGTFERQGYASCRRPRASATMAAVGGGGYIPAGRQQMAVAAVAAIQQSEFNTTDVINDLKDYASNDQECTLLPADTAVREVGGPGLPS